MLILIDVSGLIQKNISYQKRVEKGGALRHRIYHERLFALQMSFWFKPSYVLNSKNSKLIRWI